MFSETWKYPQFEIDKMMVVEIDAVCFVTFVYVYCTHNLKVNELHNSLIKLPVYIATFITIGELASPGNQGF